jgi:hypothetical protein
MKSWFLSVAAIVALTGIGSASARPGTADAGQTILFVGNSFTFGAPGEVWHYRPDSVRDLNGDGVGGVPALFKRFADEQGLAYAVSLETKGGQTLRFHYEQRRERIDAPFDHVVLQEYSTLDPAHPGDPAQTAAYAQKLAAMFQARRPGADIRLVSTWSRPDLTYRTQSLWLGKPIAAMAQDLYRSERGIAAADPKIAAVVPVGPAFNLAVRRGIADADPFDGIDAGKIDLWGPDHYHASKYGYYLEALTVFGSVTGRDPRRLGGNESAAHDLAIAPAVAIALQAVAADALAASR